ncbi:Ribosomal protein L9 [Rickettsiales bacterium Ac37b]|nr:Ribosomal protein L9 [Rickettsiales bacterium Ac37b]
MEVILLEKVGRLGSVGDTVKVKGGYARNFLLPRNKALRATDANKALFEQKRIEIEQKNLSHKQAAENIASQIQNIELEILRQASDDGKLFGSVSAKDIAAAFKAKGVEVTKHQVIINTAIKFIGTYAIVIGLHPEVEISVNVHVKRPELNGSNI